MPAGSFTALSMASRYGFLHFSLSVVHMVVLDLLFVFALFHVRQIDNFFAAIISFSYGSVIVRTFDSNFD